MHESAQLLKDGLHRSVWLDPDGERVRKRFRSRSAWRRVGDGRRARREARSLERLARLGLPVPELLGVERAGNAWDVLTRAIPGAESLSRRVDGALAAASLEDARAVGALVARFHAAGFLHGDLHPDNLLRAEDGAWFLIDVGGGRLSDALAPAVCLAELASLLAAVRETTSREWTRALWEAWRSGSGDHAKLRAEDEWTHLEHEARRLRHASVLRHLGRWSRESSRLVRSRDLAGQWFLYRHAPQAAEAAREAEAHAIDTARGRTQSGYLLLSGPHATVAWKNAARAQEHGLPVLTPLAFRPADPLAVFAPAGDDAARALSPDDEGAEELADALRDRGLWSSELPLVEHDAEGRLVLSPEDARPTRFQDSRADDSGFGGARG